MLGTLWNRTLKERTRTLLVHAAAEPSSWKEALEIATLLYNVGPTTGRPLTPTDLFYGVKPDVFPCARLAVWHMFVFLLVRGLYSDQRPFLACLLGICERLWAVEHLKSHNIQLAISSLLALVTTGPLHEGDGHDN
jgi:hypothetical protein